MTRQYEMISCPFCDKVTISCVYFPSAWSHKAKMTKTLPGSGTSKKSREEWVIQSGCGTCGKDRDSVERELKKLNVI